MDDNVRRSRCRHSRASRLCLKRRRWICQAISIIRRQEWSDRWRAMRAAAKHRPGLPVHRCAEMASTWLSPIAAVVCGWTRDGERATSINVETQRRAVTLIYRSRSAWRGLERRQAAGRRRMDVVPARWRAALVRVLTQHEEFAGRDELRYTGSHPNEPVACH